MRSKRVLIIDDHHETRRMLCSAVETLNRDLQVLGVPSGEEALLVLGSGEIDLLVVDIHLPGISGFELIEQAQKRNPAMMYMIITGVEDAEVRRQVAQSNAAAYFYKPVDVDTFLEAVKQSLGMEIPQQSEVKPETIAAGVNLQPVFDDLHGNCGVIWMSLLNFDGEVLESYGDFPDSDLIKSFVQNLYETLKELNNRFSVSPPMQLGGRAEDYFAVGFTPTVGKFLLVLLPWEKEREFWREFSMSRILSIFNGFLPNSTEPEQEDEGFSAWDVLPSLDEQGVDDEEVKQIISQIADVEVDPGEAEDFWNAASEEKVSIGTKGEDLSSDQVVKASSLRDEVLEDDDHSG